jgi:hypothetical protein
VATLFKEAYAGTDDISRKYSIYQSLWKQVADIRGANLTPEANSMSRTLAQKGNIRTGLGDDPLSRKALLPSEMNTIVSAPNLNDIDLLAGKSAFARKVLGTANSKWVEDHYRSVGHFATLAGPRYAIRNAGEDLMVALAKGTSPWGLVKEKYTATRLNTALQTVPGLTKTEKFAANPLGVMMRFINKKEAEANTVAIKALDAKIVSGREELFQLKKELKALDPNSKQAKTINLKIAEVEESIEGGVAGQTRQILAEALSKGKINNFLSQFGINRIKLIDDESLEILTEQIIYGNIDNSIIFSI